MTDDIIRIDGKDFERCDDDEPGNWIRIRPKRKQTGWICRGCEGLRHESGPCVEITENHAPPPRGLYPECDGFGTVWRPFYGKVVE